MKPDLYFPMHPIMGSRHRWPSSSLLLLLALLWLGNLTSAQAQCAAPTGLAVTNITGTSATLSFTPVTGAVSYTVSYTATNGSTVTTVSPNPMAPPVALTGLSPITGYTITVITNCAGGVTGGGTTVSFATVALYDEPCLAVALPLTPTCQPVSATSLGATTTPANGYSLLGCTGNQTPNDVWFTFATAATGPASTGATITVTGQYASQIRVFSAASCTGPFTDVACSGATAANTAAPALTMGSLQPATTYYVAVSQYRQLDPGGPFTICVTDPPACAPPANVAVAAVAATTARLTLVPGPGNVSYTVRYYPTLQPTQVTTLTPAPTASPILLTGLLPLTAYTVTVQARCASGLVNPVFTLTFTTTNPQDDPADAVALPVAATCQPVNSTLAGATVTVPNGYTNPPSCAASVTAPPDVWYTVTTPATGAASTGLTITAGGSTAGILRLFRSAAGAAGPFTEVGCSADLLPATPGQAPPLTVLGLTPGTTYYLSVAPLSNMLPSFTGFSLCATPPLACPAPQALTATAITQTGATLTWQVPAPVSGTFTVEYGLPGFTPGTGTIVTGLTGTSYAIASGLTPQTSYEFYVQRDCGGAGPSARSGPARFQTLATPIVAPANDNPCTAQALTRSGATCQNPTAGTLQYATRFSDPITRPFVVGYRCGTTSAGPLPPTGTNTSGQDVFYTFTTAAAGSGPASTGATVTVSGTYARLVQVLEAGSCAGPFVVRGCSEAADVNPASLVAPLVVTGLAPATTYYVVVTGGHDVNQPNYPLNPDLSFTICVSDPLACAPPTSVAVNTVTSSGATLTFTPPAAGTAYAVTATPTAGGAAAFTQTVTSSPATISGLQPNTAYTVCLTSTCGAVAGVPYCGGSFTTLLPGPPNYLCSLAVPLICGQTVLGTTLNVPQVPLPVSVLGAQYGTPGVWYSFVGTGDSIVASTCNPNTLRLGSSVGIYTGTCSSLVGLVGSQYSPNCGRSTYFAEAGFRSVAGTQYYIYAAAITAGDAGPFGLTLTCIPLPCPAPSVATVSAVTATSAIVTFTPAVGSSAPGYTVTATPTGGPAITATGSTSPITLTGLAPGTSYNVRVVANCTVNATSPPSPVVTFTTTGMLCPVPTSVSLTGITNTGATVSFTGSSLPTGYTVTATPPTGPAITASGPLSPVALTGLSPNTAYTITVQAACPGGAVSAPTAALTLTTLAGPSTCPAPTTVAIAAITPSTASVSFAATPGATAYTATATPTAGGPSVTGSAAAAPLPLTGLSPNTAYTVTVTATCPGGVTSAASATANFRTLLGTRNAELAGLVGLYPNPAHRAVTLTLPKALSLRAVSVVLYNALGQIVHEYPAITAAGPTELDLSGLPSGVYTLRLNTFQGPVSKRLVVE